MPIKNEFIDKYKIAEPELTRKAQALPAIGTNALDQVTGMQSAPLASNPSTAKQFGLTNMPLSQGVGSEGASAGVPKKELLKVLEEIADCTPQSAMEHQDKVEDCINRVQDRDWQEMLVKLLNAMKFNSKIQQRNPEMLGEKDPTAPELARKFADKLRPIVMEDQNKERDKAVHQSGAPMQMQPHMISANRQIIAAESPAPKKKKKTRGNPFRVLMGRVGKLLDHGMEKSDIVRQIGKKMNFFNDETISRAVDIVKEYNKRKHRHLKDADDDATEENGKMPTKEERFDTNPINGNVGATSGFVPTFQGGSPTPRLPFASRSAQRVFPSEESTVKGTIYDNTPDWTKRSTAELFMRLYTLTHTSKTGFTDRCEFPKPVAAAKAKSELADVKAALWARGFDADEQQKYLKDTSRFPIETEDDKD